MNTDLFWERNHEPRNVNPAIRHQPCRPELTKTLAQFDTTVSKTTADGTVLSVSTSTAYDLERNNPTVQFLHDWQTTFQMEIRRPLLQGYGVEYNRIAGPGAIPGFNQGVLIARVNTDIALATFEAQRAQPGFGRGNGLLGTVLRLSQPGRRGARPRQRLADVAEGLCLVRQREPRRRRPRPRPRPASSISSSAAQAEQAQSQLYQTESKLRYMMGIAATDGRMIRPADDPTTAKITFDWSQVQSEAMSRSVEIREARWRVKQRELELIAAKNYLLPRVDLDGQLSLAGPGQQADRSRQQQHQRRGLRQPGQRRIPGLAHRRRGPDTDRIPQAERRRA